MLHVQFDKPDIFICRYGAAEADCDQALALDPSYIKAYLRRGAARFQLGRVQEAEADYREVLRLEPGNRQAQEELKNIKKVNIPGQGDLVPNMIICFNVSNSSVSMYMYTLRLYILLQWNSIFSNPQFL